MRLKLILIILIIAGISLSLFHYLPNKFSSLSIATAFIGGMIYSRILDRNTSS